MPDLGKYEGAVLAAYGASLVLIAGIILLSLWQSRRVARALAEIEGQERKDG